ncbi:MAG: tetratricopeptide repeat protein [Bacteroidota bacterium]
MKKISLSICFCLIFIGTILAQSNIDSLVQQLDVMSGEQKVDVLLSIASAYRVSRNAEMLIHYAERSLALSKEIDYAHGQIESYIRLTAASIYENDFNLGSKYCYQAIEIANKSGNEKVLSSIYLNLGSLHQNSNLPEEAIEYYLKAAKIAEKYELFLHLSLAYHGIGVIHYNFKEFEKSVRYVALALEYVERDNTTSIPKELFIQEQKIQKSQILSNLVVGYIDINQLDSARIYIDQGLEYAKAIHYNLLLRDLKIRELNWFSKMSVSIGSIFTSLCHT